MSYWKWVLTIGCLLAAGCQPKIDLPPETVPEVMTLYSIDGTYIDPDGAFFPASTPDQEIMHRWPVLGKVEIDDATERKELWEAMRTGIEQCDSTLPPVECFNPRHVLRVEVAGKRADYFVCFECSQIEVYENEVYGSEDQTEWFPTNSYAKAAFNRVLKTANVPLAPDLN